MPEAVAGLATLAVVGIGGSFGLMRLDIDPVTRGIILTAMSGIGGMAGFLAAFFLRLRSWRAFGIRRTTRRWIMVGILVGVASFVAKGLAILAYTWLSGSNQSPQEIYGTGASGGPWSVVAATFFLSVITPIGEEFLFRGVVTTALLRYGTSAGIIGGALLFALFHGLNMIFPAALVVGLAAGEVFRRSGSIWPAVTVHAVVNLPTIPAMVLAGVGQ